MPWKHFGLQKRERMRAYDFGVRGRGSEMLGEG